jgi:hypothetical protein
MSTARASREATMNTATINNTTAEAPTGAVAYKYNDPTEPARWIYDTDEAEGIELEDPNLIEWVR